jgi:hypothetical protein
MNLQNLPNDVLDIIYQIKHRLELNDVLKEITNWEKYKYDRAIGLLTAMYDNTMIRYYEPETIADILTGLRNDGYVTTEYLYHKICNLRDDIIRLHYDPDLLVINEDIFINDTTTTLEKVLRQYD